MADKKSHSILKPAPYVVMALGVAGLTANAQEAPEKVRSHYREIYPTANSKNIVEWFENATPETLRGFVSQKKFKSDDEVRQFLDGMTADQIYVIDAALTRFFNLRYVSAPVKAQTSRILSIVEVAYGAAIRGDDEDGYLEIQPRNAGQTKQGNTARKWADDVHRNFTPAQVHGYADKAKKAIDDLEPVANAAVVFAEGTLRALGDSVDSFNRDMAVRSARDGGETRTLEQRRSIWDFWRGQSARSLRGLDAQHVEDLIYGKDDGLKKLFSEYDHHMLESLRARLHYYSQHEVQYHNYDMSREKIRFRLSNLEQMIVDTEAEKGYSAMSENWVDGLATESNVKDWLKLGRG